VGEAVRTSWRTWGLLYVLAGAVFLEGVDISMLGVALPSIQADLGMSTGALMWVQSAYVLGYAGFLLLGGRTADLLGRRRMFLFWLGVFIVFSGLGGFATEGWVLITARFVTGVAAAFMTPAGLAIVTTSFPEGPRRNQALLIYAATGAAGFTLGLVTGGLLTTFGWRWVFFAPVILTVLILAAAVPLIPKESRPDRTGQGVDVTGAVSVTGAALLVVFAIAEGPNLGWQWTTAGLIGGLALLGVFVAAERRSAFPLVRLGILRSGALLRANLTAMLLFGAFLGFQFIVVLYLQQLRGWSPLETGLALLVAGLDVILAPTLTPWLVNRYGNTKVIFGGMVLAVLAFALFLPVGLDWTYAAMFPSMLLIGLTFSFAYGPLTIAATDGIPEEEQGLAGGLLYTSWQLGGALGLAAVTAVKVAATSGDTPQAVLDGFHAALLVPVGAAILGTLIMGSGLRRRRAVPESATVAV
jgi:MFS family permease